MHAFEDCMSAALKIKLQSLDVHSSSSKLIGSLFVCFFLCSEYKSTTNSSTDLKFHLKSFLQVAFFRNVFFLEEVILGNNLMWTIHTIHQALLPGFMVVYVFYRCVRVCLMRKLHRHCAQKKFTFMAAICGILIFLLSYFRAQQYTNNYSNGSEKYCAKSFKWTDKFFVSFFFCSLKYVLSLHEFLVFGLSN